MNAPPRHESYVLDDGEKAVEIMEDTKITNAATVKIVKQDHTLGNMLRAELLAMPQIVFAGYKVPHPLHPYFLIRLQTDGTITPQVALEQACNKLIATISSLENKFKREFQFKEEDAGVHGGMGGAGGHGAGQGMSGADDPYGTGSGGGTAWGKGREYLDF